MALRIVVQTDDGGLAVNVGGTVHSEIKSFDIEAQALEAFLREKMGTYGQRQVIGVELIESKQDRCIDLDTPPGEDRISYHAAGRTKAGNNIC